MTQKVHPVGQLFGGVLRPQTHMGTCGVAPPFRAKELNLAVNYLLRFLNFDFGAFLAQMRQIFYGISPKFPQNRNSIIEADS